MNTEKEWNDETTLVKEKYIYWKKYSQNKNLIDGERERYIERKHGDIFEKRKQRDMK